MLGSGAVVVVGDDVCMLDLALNVGRFFRNESCGKCVPCRVGSEKIVMLLEGILEGNGSWADLELIEELSDTMALTSICGLGQAAPNPILSVIKHFKDDITRYLSPSSLEKEDWGEGDAASGARDTMSEASATTTGNASERIGQGGTSTASGVRITMDGQPLDVAPGTTLYEAAQQAGIDIPVLCHSPKLEPVGVCRTCVWK